MEFSGWTYLGWVELSGSATFAIASLSKEKDDGGREAVKTDEKIDKMEVYGGLWMGHDFQKES